MTAFSWKSSVQERRKNHFGHALMIAALLSNIVGGSHAFSLPIGFTSSQQITRKYRIRPRSSTYDHQITVHLRHNYASKMLFAAQYYNDRDQWGDDADPAFEQQANSNESSFRHPEDHNFDGFSRAIVGSAALGTMMAINNAMGMSVGAETVTTAAQASSDDNSQLSVESYSVTRNSQPEVTLPYLEKQIQAAEEEEALRNADVSYELTEPASAETINIASASDSFVVGRATIDVDKVVAHIPTQQMNDVNSVTDSTSETTAALSPSFIRYAKDHIPSWIETGHQVYDAAAPKVMAGGKAIVAEVDEKVTPMIIAKEHELFGDENSVVLDKTLSDVAAAGKMMAGFIGKAVSVGIEGGIQVAKMTPEVITAAQQVYKTIDEKIVPEVLDTGMKMKTIVDKTVPEVVDTGMHAYTTIMPEVMKAEKQVASSVKNGLDIVMPNIIEMENKIMPEFSKIEHSILGEEQSVMIEKTVAEVAQQGQNAFETVEKTIPMVISSGQKTVDGVANTGRTVARAVPVMMETGKQAYNSVDRTLSDAISTTQDITGDLDRAAGKTVYAIEDNLPKITGTIDKTLPTLLEAGRNVAISGSQVAKGGKAIYEDMSNAVDDLKVAYTLETAVNRFAATKSIFQEITASVNDPNQLGKL